MGSEATSILAYHVQIHIHRWEAGGGGFTKLIPVLCCGTWQVLATSVCSSLVVRLSLETGRMSRSQGFFAKRFSCAEHWSPDTGRKGGQDRGGVTDQLAHGGSDRGQEDVQLSLLSPPGDFPKRVVELLSFLNPTFLVTLQSGGSDCHPREVVEFHSVTPRLPTW